MSGIEPTVAAGDLPVRIEDVANAERAKYDKAVAERRDRSRQAAPPLIRDATAEEQRPPLVPTFPEP